MNNKLLHRKGFFAFLFLWMFCATSCQKADDNGALGGFWKLMELEYAADGTVKDLKKKSYFMAVQLDLMKFSGEYYARFSHEGDSLFVWMIGDVSQGCLDIFAFDAPEQRFCVERLNGKSLVLKSKYSRLRFKKF